MIVVVVVVMMIGSTTIITIDRRVVQTVQSPRLFLHGLIQIGSSRGQTTILVVIVVKMIPRLSSLSSMSSHGGGFDAVNTTPTRRS
jgi:hypothetical protein